MVQAFAELDKVEKELRKLNPDVIHYDKDGAPHAPAYSKAVFESRKKVLERQGRLEKALEKALGDAQDYNDLSSLVGKQDKRNRMTSQSQKVLDIQKAVGERVKARLPSVLFKALVRQHERTGFRTGCTCKYCKEKRIVSHLTGYGDSYYDIMILQLMNFIRERNLKY